MANNQNTNSTILSEHRKIVSTRYVLAIFNFIAVLLGMIVTLFFVSRRGIYDNVLTVIWVLIIINAVQIVLCLTEYVFRSAFGINLKFLPVVSYIVGVLWIAALVVELVLATIEVGTLRTDLLIVSIIQAVVAIVAYILWPHLDRSAIDSMIKPSSRGDEKKRNKKAKSYVAAYGMLTVLIVLAQAATLLLYKMPPTLYDLFADNRALQYELNEDKDGYIVTSVYNGTSPNVNVPATYNNLPVVGIKSGALVDEGIIEKYKITSITFGTLEKDDEGNDVLKSNIQFINSGAIVCSRIESISIPASVTAIEDGAVRGAAIRTVEYSAKAHFNYAAFSGCENLVRVLMSGENVGAIASLEGMPERVNIQVDKDIYNIYRQSNLNYVSSFSPILADDEFCVDFFTGCDYYIDSIFAKKGETVKLTYASFKKEGASGNPLSIDTLAYINDDHELGTDGAKENAAFRGWYLDGNFVEKVEFASEYSEISINDSAKLYAKWITEYNATLNWGTHKPDGQVDKVYWTEEDLRSFPEVYDRAGYSDGVIWTLAGTDTQLVNSNGITESINLNATWRFDAPSISLSPSLLGGSEEVGGEYVNFVYDELKYLQLATVKSHSLQNATDIPDEMKVVTFDYEWYKDGELIEDYVGKSNITVQNVLESGEYTLRVKATSPYSTAETNYSEVVYTVVVAKKPLNIGTATFDYTPAEKNLVYNGREQYCVVSGNVADTGVVISYSYANADGYSSTSGITNAGKYTAVATFSKADPNEAANYEIKEITTEVTIERRALKTPTWSSGDFTYNRTEDGKTEYGIYVSFAEEIAGENVGVVYKNEGTEVNRATDANTYTAIAIAVDNPNYVLDVEDSAKLKCSWTIKPKPVIVESWTLDGKSQSEIIYNGAEHKVEAVVSGVMTGDEHVSFSYEGSTMLATNAGSYVAEVSGLNDSNYTFDDTATFEWSVLPAQLTVTFDSNANPKYNGTEQTVSATITGIVASDVASFKAEHFNTEGTTATVKLGEGNDASSLKLLFGATNVAPQDYVAKINSLYSSADDTHLANYEIEEAKEHSFNITPAVLTVVKPVDKTYEYNGVSQRLDVYVEGFVEGEEELALVQLAVNEGCYIAVEDGKVVIYRNEKNAGSYDITLSAVDNANYTITTTEATTETTKSITIDKKTVSLSWGMWDKAQNASVAWGEKSEFTYNKAGYRVTYTVVGAVEGENVTFDLEGDEYVDANSEFYTTKASLEDAAINAVNANYTFDDAAEDAEAKWKINPKDITLVWKVDGGAQTTFVYSKTKHNVTYEIQDIISGDEIEFTYDQVDAPFAATDVAEYKITVKSFDNTNYRLVEGSSFTWSITPKPITISWRIDTNDVGKDFVTYSKDEHIVNAVYELYEDDETEIEYDVAKNTIKATNANKSGEKYYVSAIKLTNKNYVIDGDKSDFEWTINPLVVQVEWSENEFIYNADYQYPTVVFQNKYDGDTIVVEYSGRGVSAGEHTVSISKIGNSNYTIVGAENLAKTYTIAPKVIVPSWTEQNFVYDATEKVQYATYDTYASESDDGKVYYGDSLEFEYEGNKATDANDKYTAKVIGTGNSNYVLTTDRDKCVFEWSIAKCPVTLSWSYNFTTYNSEIQYPIATVTNKHNQEVNVTEYEGTGLAAETKGNYAIKAIALDNTNFTLVGGTTVEHSYDIKARVLTYEWYGVRTDDFNILRDINNLVYDGYQTSVLVRFTNVCSGDDIEPVYSANKVISADDVGKTVTVTLDGVHKDNYTFPETGITKTVKVAQQPVKITWSGDSNVVYNGYSHNLTATVVGSVAGEVKAVEFTVNSGAADGFVDAGTYSYEIALNNDNFTLVGCDGPKSVSLIIVPKAITVTWDTLEYTYDGNPKTVTASHPEVSINVSNNTKTSAGEYTLTATAASANYTVENKTVIFKIKKAQLTATWSGDTNPTYNGSSYAFGVVVTNALNPSVKPDFYVTYKKNGSSVEPEYVIDAGTYSASIVFTYSSDSQNYEFTDSADLSRTLVINKKQVSLTGWSQDSYVYNGTDRYITATVNDAGAQATLGYLNNSIKNVGRTVASVTLGSNYVFADGTVTTHVLEVTPATLTVSWDADSDMTYKYDTTYDLSATLSGRFGSDSVSFVYNIATSVSNAGTYSLVITGLSGSASGNYKLPDSGLEKTYVVKKQEVAIRWNGLTTTYDGTLQKPTLEVYGKIDTSMNVSYSPILGYDNVGEYDYEVVLTNTNYTLDNCNGSTTATMKINPAIVTITWPTTTSVTYTGNAQSLTPTVKGVNGTVISASLITVSGSSGVNVGSYAFEVTDIDDSNYTLVGAANKSQTLTITPRLVTVTWSNMSQTYGMMDDDIVFATLENAVYGDDVYAVISGFYTTLSAGEHTLRVSGLAGDDCANYAINSNANITATLVVNKQKVTATWSNLDVTYDGTPHKPTLTITSMTGEDLSDQAYAITEQIDAYAYYSYSAYDYFESDNYEIDGVASCTFVIRKAQILSSDFTVSYDKETGTFSVIFTDAPLAVTVADEKLVVRDASGAKLQNGSIAEAGTYSITFNIADIVAGDNYEVLQGSTAAKYITLTEADVL